MPRMRRGSLGGCDPEDRCPPVALPQFDVAADGGPVGSSESNDRCTDFTGLSVMSCASNQSLQMSASSWRSALFVAISVRSSAYAPPKIVLPARSSA